MDASFWRERWEQNQIGFHRDDVHPSLLEHADTFVAGGRRILVPLCGKSHDLLHLVRAGLEVVGVELVSAAVEAFHEEQGIEPEIGEVGDFRTYRSEGLTIYCGDFFALDVATIGQFDRIWDRAALIALDPERRRRYVSTLRALAGDGALLLQSLVEYEQSVMSGPPWSVSRDEIDSHYGDLAVEELSVEDVVEGSRWAERGHKTWIESTYLIRF